MRQRLDENRIYEVALKQFADYGYKKATLEDIAAELNMTGASLYSYASSKQALYYDSVAYGFRKWQAYCMEAMDGLDDVVEIFRALCVSAVDYLGRDDAFRAILKRDPAVYPIFSSEDPYKGINRDSVYMLKDVLDRGVDEGVFVIENTMTCTKILFSLFKSMILEAYVENDAPSIDVGLTMTMDFILKGMLKRK